MKLKDNIVELLTKCLEDSANEVCAFLLEDNSGEQQIIRVRNLSGDPHGFIVASTELRRVEEYAKSIRSRIKAFIHSHAASLRLSKEDYESFKYSNFYWLIIKLGRSGLQVKLYK